MNKYNILEEQWIPVNSTNGVEYISVYELFKNSDRYTGFAGDPVENYSLLRFICAIAQSSKKSQCKSFGEYKKLKHTFSDNAIEYLDNHYNYFWMESNQPFLLCTEAEIGLDRRGKEIKAGPIQLREKYAEGNNAVISDRDISSYNSWDSIVLDLLVRCTYSVAFGKSGAVPTRSTLWGKSTLGIVNVFITGKNLTETIYLNLQYPDAKHKFEFGIPVWESRFVDTYEHTYLNQLVTLSSKIWIANDFSNMKTNIGINYSDHESLAFKSMRTVKDKTEPLKFINRNKIWSEFGGVLSGSGMPSNVKNAKLVNDISRVGINTLSSYYKLSMGCYSTEDISTSYQLISNPSKLNNDEYIKFYSDCIELVTETIAAIEQSFCGVRMSVRFGDTKPSKHERTLIYNERNILSNIVWDFLDTNSYMLFQCDGTSDDFSEWKSIVKSALNKCEAYMQRKYGIVTWNKFIYTKAITQLKIKRLSEDN